MTGNWFVLLFLGVISRVVGFFQWCWCVITKHDWVELPGRDVFCRRCGTNKKGPKP